MSSITADSLAEGLLGVDYSRKSIFTSGQIHATLRHSQYSSNGRFYREENINFRITLAPFHHHGSIFNIHLFSSAANRIQLFPCDLHWWKLRNFMPRRTILSRKWESSLSKRTICHRWESWPLEEYLSKAKIDGQ